MGDFGFNLFYTGLNLYLLYYYTDILGIGPATAGLIFMLPVIWDAITDPIMGWIASRTKTRWGKYRPYVLFGGPIMALTFVLMFAAPVLFPGYLVMASAISHILFRTAYTIVSIPYSAMSATLTQNGDERSKIAGARMLFAVLGGLFTAAATLWLARYIGGEDLAIGFVWVAILFAILATAIMTGVFFATWEKKPVKAEQVTPLNMSDTVFFLKENAAFWILFLAVFFGAFGSSIGGKALVYYITYYAQAPDAVSLILTASLLSTGIAVPFWSMAAQRFSKRDIWIGAAIGAAICQAVLLYAAPTSVSFLLTMLCVVGIFNAALITMFWAMLPDTVEYGEWRSGIRDEGILFGINQFALKAASGLGVGLLGLLLEVINYEAGQLQSSWTLEGLRYVTFGAPLCAGLVAAVIIGQSPMTRRRHAQLVIAIERRRHR